jgi:hypothetical protein
MEMTKLKPTAFQLLGGAFFLLIILTIISAFAGRIDFEQYNHVLLPLKVNLVYLNEIIVLAIACLQAVIFAVAFLGIRHDQPLYLGVFLTALLILFIFVTLTLTDTLFRGTMDEREAQRLPEAVKVVK